MARVIKDPHTGRIFENRRAVAGAELARVRTQRRDFHVLCERAAARRNRHRDQWNVPAILHASSPILLRMYGIGPRDSISRHLREQSIEATSIARRVSRRYSVIALARYISRLRWRCASLLRASG